MTIPGYSTPPLYYGAGDINDLTTLPTGLFIDAMGAHIFNNGVEVGRNGDLNGYLNYLVSTFGIGIGGPNGYLTYDPANGLRIKGTLATFGIFPLGLDAWDEDVVGNANGTNKYFATANPFASGTLQLLLNGQWLKGGGTDYSEGSANGLYMSYAPQTGDAFLVNYIKASDLSTVYNEVPGGSINGSNTSFTTAFNHVFGSLMVFLNGIALDFDDDYVAGTRAMILTAAPQTNDQLTSAYKATADAKLIMQEIPTGLINSSNTVFTLANNYVAGTPVVVLNGIKMSITNDYTESGANQLTFTFGPTTGDSLWVTYRKP